MTKDTAPVLEGIDIPLLYKRMDATFTESEPLSIFRQDPSPEVDRAWARLGDTRPIPLSREDVLAIGKDPDQAIKLPKSWGLGEDVYAGRVDVFHQIVCVPKSEITILTQIILNLERPVLIIPI